MYPKSMFLAKIRKNVTFLHVKISFFPLFEVASYHTPHGHVFVMFLENIYWIKMVIFILGCKNITMPREI